MRTLRPFLAPLAIAASLALVACGGGGSSAPAPIAPPTIQTGGGNNTGSGTETGTTEANVVPITLDGGTDGRAFNSPFVTVTVCVPGTTTCQALDHVLVDTGSFGLRILASALDASVQLPRVSAPVGNTLAECAPFASGYAWGSVRTADVRIGGESAAGLPVQLVDDATIAAAPSTCTALGSDFGVGGSGKGILGIGSLVRDCGSGCASIATSGIYYGCDGSACTGSVAPLSSQVANPVAFFAADGNGVVVSLPPVPATGLATATGTLTFGIGTRANNALGSATVYATDSRGSLTTTFSGTRYPSFFDTGSNGLFFNDPDLPQCPSGGFYCPATPQALSAMITSATGVSATVDFTVAGLQSLAADTTVAPVGGSSGTLGRVFDWGLPFFFGRTVFVAITGAATPGGTGPFIAF